MKLRDAREQEECGALSPNHEKSPAQEILEEKGEIFSCGGVYLPFYPPLDASKNHVQYLHLPNRKRDVKVLKDLKTPTHSHAEDSIRRFFRDDLN